MSTSDAVPVVAGSERAPAVKPALWALAVLAAVAGVYGIATGANPLWTLAAGIAVGGLISVARRDGGATPGGAASRDRGDAPGGASHEPDEER